MSSTIEGKKCICEECGKEFTIFSKKKDYAYRYVDYKGDRHLKYFCSYSCYEKGMKRHGKR